MPALVAGMYVFIGAGDGGLRGLRRAGRTVVRRSAANPPYVRRGFTADRQSAIYIAGPGNDTHEAPQETSQA
jgi:hypothetical protein